MKNRVFILSFLISMISVNFVFAQTSTKKLSYQAVVRNAANELVVNQNLAVEITVLDAENAPQYKETHPSVPTNQNGLLWLWVGEGNPTLGTMEDVVWKDAVIRSVFTLPDGSTVTQNTPVTAMPYAYFADEVDTIFLQNYLDTHDVVPDNYVTHPQLNDTLNSFATKDTLSAYATKDTLKYYTTINQIDTLLDNYLTIEGLCDSIENNCTNVALKNKDNLFTYRNQFDSTVFFKNETQFDSIAYFNERTYFDKDVNIDGDVIFKGYNYYYNVNNFYEHGAIVLIDEAVNPNTLGPVQSTQDQNLSRRLAVNYNDLMVVYDTLKETAQSGDAALAARIVVDSNRLVEFKRKVHNDSLALAAEILCDSVTMMDTLHTYYATKDTLKNFLTISGLCDSLVKCGVIKDMRDSIRDNATAIQINATNIQTNATNIGLNKQAIIDSSAHIRNDIKNGQITIAVNRSTATTETTVTNPTFGVNQRTDQTVTINIPQETTVNNGQLTIVAAGDTTRFTANQATNDTVRLDKFATKDTLSKYTTTDNIDTIVNKHHFLTSDSALIVRMRDSIQKVNAHVSADSLALANRITYDSTKLVERIVADSTALAEKIYTDSLALAQRMDTAYKYLCDSIEKNCTNVALKDKDNLFTLRNQFDSTVFFKDATYFDSTAYFNERAYFDEDVNVKGDVIFKGYNYYFSVNNFYEHDAIVLIDEAVNPNTLGPVQSTPDNNLNRRLAVNYNDLMVVYDSLNHKAQIDNSALANRIVADSNRFVVFQNKVHEDSLTLANRIHADSVTLTSKIRTDSIALVNRIVADSTALVEKIKADSTTLATRMDTVYKHLCDSVMNCDGIKALQTADNNLSTRIHNDSLKLVDFKTKVHNDSLTLANRIHADSVTLTNKIRTDSVALVNRIVADSSALVKRIVADSTALSRRMDTLLTHVCDSVQSCVTGWIKDSLTLVRGKMHDDSLTLATRIYDDSTKLQANIDTVSSHIRAIIPTVSDATVTINVNTTPAGSFTLNQGSNAEVYLNNIAITTADNIFSGDNNFTGTNTVPNGFVIKGENATTESNCGNIVVNACDLWAVFDSLNRRINALQEELDAFKNAAPPVFNSLNLSEVTATSMKVTSSFTSQGFNITSYNFCYSTNSDMSGSVCVPSTNPVVTLEGLDPHTTYYVTASATNVIGTTQSDTVNAKTHSNAPTATVTATTTTPKGITVSLSNLDFKQPGEGTVQIFYKKKTEAACGTNIADYTSLPVSGTISNGNPYSQSITNLELEAVYCVIVKLQNEDSVTYTNPIEVTSGASDKFEITTDYEGYYGHSITSFWPCKPDNTITVQFVASSLVESIADYDNFNWSFEVVPMSGNGFYPLPLYEILKENRDTLQVKFTSQDNVNAWFRIVCTATNTQTTALITGSAVHRVRQYGQNNSVSRPTINETMNGTTVQINSSLYDLIYWGDGTDTMDTSDPASGTHLYSEPGEYTVWVLKKTIQSGGDNYFVCDASKTITVVEPPANKYKCHVSTPHQVTGNGYNNGSGAANDGYEETDANGDIISVTDYDGNVYPVVQIGSQCWMAENLRCQYSPNTGSNIVDNSLSGSQTQNKKYFRTATGKSAHWFDNNSETYASYGLLYNYCAAMDFYKYNEFSAYTQHWDARSEISSPHRGICPKGWHIPTNDEWTTLKNNENANQPVKLAGDGWQPNTDCQTCPGGTANRNLSGFTALPAARVTGTYQSFPKESTETTCFWSSTCSTDYASSAGMSKESSQFGIQPTNTEFQNLYSVRCIRDAEQQP